MSEVFLATERFAVTQRLTMMVNRYEIRALRDGAPGELFAMAQQKRIALRESVTFYADEDRRPPVFGFRADRRLDLGATYAVTDGAGRTIGSFRKDFARSLLRSTWHLEQPGMGSLSWPGAQCRCRDPAPGLGVHSVPQRSPVRVAAALRLRCRRRHPGALGAARHQPAGPVRRDGAQSGPGPPTGRGRRGGARRPDVALRWECESCDDQAVGHRV